MSQAEVKAAAAEQEVDEAAEESQSGGVFESLRTWMFNDSPWWLVSCALHSFIFLALALLGKAAPPRIMDDAPAFGEATDQQLEVPPDLERFEIGQPPEEPTELTTDTLSMNEAPSVEAAEEKYYDDNPVFREAGGGMAITASPNSQVSFGGGGGFEIKGVGPGPMVRGGGGIGVGVGAGKNPGSGGDGFGFGGRGQGHRKAMVGSYGGTKASERSVAGALNWIARHQLPDGRWSLSQYKKLCKDATCTGEGAENQDTGATAMGLLPYLAAGQTHMSKGPYRPTITNGLAWLMRTQKPDGDLRGTGGTMYSHGLAAITLCEAYGLTNDKAVGYAAQAAINFIEAAQNKTTGGWRYTPGEEGDTSVVGWQLMACKSGMMAGLKVNPATLDGVKRWLKSVSKDYGGKYSYTPTDAPSNTMTSVGLLCAQYLGAQKDDPGMINGTKFMMTQTPDKGARNIYYWYYATQVMHNFTGPEWDQWNRITRRTLIDTQSKDRDLCSNGSWDPDKPAKDQWGSSGGRLMMTSLGALTLEVYYRYLPLYKLNKEEEANKGALDLNADKKDET